MRQRRCALKGTANREFPLSYHDNNLGISQPPVAAFARHLHKSRLNSRVFLFFFPLILAIFTSSRLDQVFFSLSLLFWAYLDRFKSVLWSLIGMNSVN